MNIDPHYFPPEPGPKTARAIVIVLTCIVLFPVVALVVLLVKVF